MKENQVIYFRDDMTALRLHKKRNGKVVIIPTISVDYLEDNIVHLKSKKKIRVVEDIEEINEEISRL